MFKNSKTIAKEILRKCLDEDGQDHLHLPDINSRVGSREIELNLYENKRMKGAGTPYSIDDNNRLTFIEDVDDDSEASADITYIQLKK